MTGRPSGSTSRDVEMVRLGRKKIHLRVKGGHACGRGGRWASKTITTTTNLAKVTCVACRQSRAALEQRASLSEETK